MTLLQNKTKYFLSILAVLVIVLLSCKKEQSIGFPELKSFEDVISQNSAILKIGESDIIEFNSERISSTDLCNLLKPEFLKKSSIILKNDKKTRYSFYLEMFQNIEKCYFDTLDEISEERYGQPLGSIDSILKVKLKKEFPMKIAETKPGN